MVDRELLKAEKLDEAERRKYIKALEEVVKESRDARDFLYDYLGNTNTAWDIEAVYRDLDDALTKLDRLNGRVR